MFEISLSLLSAFGSGCMVFRKQNQYRDKSDKGQGNGLKLSNVEPGQFLDGRPEAFCMIASKGSLPFLPAAKPTGLVVLNVLLSFFFPPFVPKRSKQPKLRW